jgi:uncharacterized protein (DUF1778 family)
MPDVAALLAFAAVALGMVLTPGPNMAYLVARSIRPGRARAQDGSRYGTARGDRPVWRRQASSANLYCDLRYSLTQCPLESCPAWSFAVTPAAERKDHPLSMRLPKADIAIIDRAAGLRGRSRTEFVRDAAVRAAEEVVMESAPIRMSAEGFAAFLKILSEPPEPIPAMVALLGRPAPWDEESEAG